MKLGKICLGCLLERRAHFGKGLLVFVGALQGGHIAVGKQNRSGSAQHRLH